MLEGNALGLAATYECYELCDLVHLEGAEALAVYQDDFYAGRPAITLNRFGQGKAYYVASRNREPFFDDFVGEIITESGATRVINTELPAGVTAQLRTDGEHDYVFLLNFNAEERSVVLDEAEYFDLLGGETVRAEAQLESYGVRVLKRDPQITSG